MKTGISRIGAIAAVLAVSLVTALPALAESTWRWNGVSRVVAVGDVHGAYDELFATLDQAGVIDGSGAWAGGSTHLVSLGDLVDRGARSRDVMDLLMRLEAEAAEAGGRVHLLLGNHEVMNMTGELDYVSPEEIAAFAADASEERRAAEYANWLSRTGRPDGPDSTTAFAEAFPPGFFAHRDAFSPEGRYGRWLLDKPLIIVINRTVFTHAGLSEMISTRGAQAINASAATDIQAYLDLFANLTAAGVIGPETGFNDRLGAVKNAARADAASQLESLLASPVFDADGPVWYRGTAWCHPLTEVIHLQRQLDVLEADRVVIGHTPTRDAVQHSRMKGRAVMIDTGMLAAVYEGRPSALVIEGDRMQALYAGQAAPVDIGPLPRRVGQRPAGTTDDELERILATGEIIAIKDVGQGVTKPQKVTIRHAGNDYSGLFKTESTPIDGGSRRQTQRLVENSDRWEHEVAAYRLDRMLGLELVPVTVAREINGRTGALQFWVENLISELERQEDNITATGWCPLSEQYNLMVAFDSLIYNVDRTLQNIVYDRDSWMLYLIDHSRGFRLNKGRPKDISKVELVMSQDLVQALQELSLEALRAEMGDLLIQDQLRAILRRRDELVKAAAGD
jgi:hypothetical protein